METKRAQTLEALETFIQMQRALLERTQTDITRLHRLRSDAATQPAAFVSDLSTQLDANSFRLSEQVDCRLSLPQNIEWALYDGQGSTSLKALASTTQQTYAQRHHPSPYQRAPLSELQKFVKEARRTIVDPVLSHLATLFGSDADDPESESGLNPSKFRFTAEELNREREREKLRELKKRKISGYGGLGLPSVTCAYPQRGRTRGSSGVFVRRDVEDESAEVDVDLSLDLVPNGPSRQGSGPSSTSMEVDLPPPPSRPSTLSRTASPLPRHTSRIRRPSNKLQATQSSVNSTSTTNPKIAARKRKRDPSTESEPDIDQLAAPAAGKTIGPSNGRASDKPKSGTYKQAWSMSEQHLLEQLLEQIPDGAKNRWQKISRAMDGKRTPRQVASRVQKYFEKLKRFGIGTSSR